MPAQNFRINLPSQSFPNRDFQNKSLQTGFLNGTRITVCKPEDDVDDQIELDYLRQNLGLDSPKIELQLKMMKINVNDKSPLSGHEDTQKYLHAIGQHKNSSELAQNFLQRLIKGIPLPPPGKSLTEIAEFNSALQRIDSALQGTDEQFLEQLSPLSSEVRSLTVLAKKLQEAGNDAKQMKLLLSDFRGIPEDEEEILKKFGTVRFDKNYLNQELRQAQHLPHLDERAKAQIGEKVLDEMKELQRQHGSHLFALRNLLEKAGDLTSKELAESYDELVHGTTSGFAATMEMLVTKHSHDKLLDTVIPVIEKTLSHEISLDENQRSVDKERLYSILSELQHMHILKMLIERLDGFISSLGRLYGATVN